HAMLKAKYLTDVSTVHSAFKKYVDHMKQDHESDQKQKLSYLLAYVQLCANVLDEDASTHPARTLDELEKVNKYVVRIVLPYLKKLKTEKDRRTSGGSNTPQSGSTDMNFLDMDGTSFGMGDAQGGGGGSSGEDGDGGDLMNIVEAL
ncbi:hypothetical protein DYB35_013855, partial [Aphanomyces astaci]